MLDTFFRQIKSFLRFRLSFVFGIQTYYMIDFSKIYGLKGLEPQNLMNDLICRKNAFNLIVHCMCHCDMS